MATYAIGDIQGCVQSFQKLLNRISFDPQRDTLWLVGDLVNRGPGSLATLRYIKHLGTAVQAVLGNHDLFLLAAAEGIVRIRPKDTIRDVLEAKDRTELVDWLRQVPLHRRDGSYFMVHAGLLPQWTIEEATGFAEEIGTMLSGPNYRAFLQDLFHGPTPQWDPSLTGSDRLTTIARVFTRLRTCTASGEMSSFSGPPEEAPKGFVPWFRFPERRNKDAIIITGHWAALGLRLETNHWAIDSGCVWGRQLTAVRLEDRTVFQVDCAD